VAGPTDPLAELEADSCRVERNPTVLLAGYGIVGSTVSNELDDAGIEYRVIDMTDGPQIDIVGDATESKTLQRAGIVDAAAFVVALDDDDAAVLSILAADEVAGNTDVIARMNDPANETNIRRAGAKYVLGVPTISGRLLVSEVLQEPVIGVDRQLRTAHISGGRFAGKQLRETPFPDTDCVVVGVERNETVHTDISNDFALRSDDKLIVVGSDYDINTVS
jgi:Trk K+ transport system NAD-binding subunit